MTQTHDAETVDRVAKALENARAKVRDVTPAEKSRIACQRASEWLRLRALSEGKT